MITALLSATILQAQNEPFRGGFGSGDVNIGTSLLSCSQFRFSGGFGEGYNNLKSDLVNTNDFRFAGGFGRGDSSTNTNLVDNNIFRFAGGTGRGDSSINTTLVNFNTFRFSGGFGRGDSSLNTDDLSCNTFRFYGGIADGAAMDAFIKKRDFLGPDTSVLILCSSERVSLNGLYDSTDLKFIWNTANPADAGPGAFTLVATTASGCKDTAVATVYQKVAVWKGSVSNNWHNAANWSNNLVPDSVTHVIIPGGTANGCQVSEADAEAASVQGKLNGQFNIINNRRLKICANCNALPTGQ
jgi:hypothetical protein